MAAEPPERQTVVGIEGSSFLVNGQPTYRGRVFNGVKVEGLLLNARMVQGIFDDLNPETRKLWAYSDGSAFDAITQSTHNSSGMSPNFAMS